MFRSTVAALLASAPLLGAISPGGAPSGKPPSSLEPGQPRGTITLSHDHQRVVACVAERKSGELSCQAKQESTDRGTSLALRPVDDSGKLSEEDRRAPVRVRLEDGPSPQTEEIELAVGAWEVDWQGLRQRTRFRVQDEDEFKIGLSTVAGACKKVRSRCVVAPAALQRSVSIPDPHRVQ